MFLLPLDADKVGHEVLCMPSIVGQIEEKWGGRVVVDGKVDRRELAKIVFPSDSDSPTRALKYLEQLTHPEIGKSIAFVIRSFLSMLIWKRENNVQKNEVGRRRSWKDEKVTRCP